MKTMIRLTAEKRAGLAFALALLAFSAAMFSSLPVVGGAIAQAQPGGPPPDDFDDEDDDDAPPPPPSSGEKAQRADRREAREELRQRRMEMREARKRERGVEREGKGPRGPGLGGKGRALEMIQSYQAAVQDPHQAIGLAAMGIKHHYRREGKPLEAVKELEELMKSATDQKTRNIFLFTIRQVYEEERDAAKTLELSRQIIKENMARGKAQ